MIVKINNYDFLDAGWSVYKGVGTLSLDTDEPLLNILNLIAENNVIEIYDDEHMLISVWQNNGFKSADSDTINDKRRVTIEFDVNVLSSNAEELIHKDINDNLNGIIELAGLIDNIDSSTMQHDKDIRQLQTQVEQDHNQLLELNSQMNLIPNDSGERFNALQAQYNALADRVASLENRGNLV